MSEFWIPVGSTRNNQGTVTFAVTVYSKFTVNEGIALHKVVLAPNFARGLRSQVLKPKLE